MLYLKVLLVINDHSICYLHGRVWSEIAELVAASLIWHCVSNNSQILASHVYFWDNEEDELELMHSRKMYPPRFTLQVATRPDPTHDAVAMVEFEGAYQNPSTEIYFSLP